MKRKFKFYSLNSAGRRKLNLFYYYLPNISWSSRMGERPNIGEEYQYSICFAWGYAGFVIDFGY